MPDVVVIRCPSCGQTQRVNAKQYFEKIAIGGVYPCGTCPNMNMTYSKAKSEPVKSQTRFVPVKVGRSTILVKDSESTNYEDLL
jgi:ribosomal protein S27E